MKEHEKKSQVTTIVSNYAQIRRQGCVLRQDSPLGHEGVEKECGRVNKIYPMQNKTVSSIGSVAETRTCTHVCAHTHTHTNTLHIKQF